MVPEAREVRLRRKDRKVLKAHCRWPVTLQRDLKSCTDCSVGGGRAQHPVDRQRSRGPADVSLWRHRYADHGFEGLTDKPRPGKKPIYTKATDKRILGLPGKPPPAGFAHSTGPLLAEKLGDVDVKYVWRFLRSHKINLEARKS